MREIDKADERFRQWTRRGHVVDALSYYGKVEPVHGIQDVRFFSSTARHLPKARGGALATDIENRRAVGNSQRRVPAVSCDLSWITSVGVHLPHLQAPAAIRSEVNRSTIPRPAWNTVGSTAIG